MPLAPRSLHRWILGHRTALLNPALRSLPLILSALLLPSGCSREPRPLGLKDLDPGERLYVQRVVVLERAKAVAQVDRAAGGALLDSLAAAWGDSSLPETLAGAPTQPLRAAAVGDLLCRILAAEQDSLSLAPRPDRLGAPLPDPPPSAVAIEDQAQDD